MFTTFTNKTKGFTLIELLVVIAIIGILSSVVLASLGTARQKARDATRISDMKNVQLANELYYDSNQSYASTTAAATVLLNGANVVAALVPTYIPTIPVDPQSGSRSGGLQYLYEGLTAVGGDCVVVGGCPSYILGATMERPDNTVLDGDSGDNIVASVRGRADNHCLSASDGGSTAPGNVISAAATNGVNELCYSTIP